MQIIDILVLIGTPIAQAASEASAEASSGLLGTLGINWKLFLAQLVNFGIVLYVLRRWVFAPVAKKLSERSEKIEVALKDAEQIAAEKVSFESWKKEAIEEARVEAAAIINEAKKQAEQLKTSMLQQTKEEQNVLISKAQQQISEETDRSVKAIKTEVADLVVRATEKVLREKLDATKDAALIKQALKEVE